MTTCSRDRDCGRGGSLRLYRGQGTAYSNPDGATVITRQLVQDQEDGATSSTRETAALATRYSFREGALKGLTAGVAARYAAGRVRPGGVTIGGVVVFPPNTTTDDYIITNPFVSYRRKFGRLTGTFQLNVNNVFDVRSNQGAIRFPRYTEPRQFMELLKEKGV